MSTGGESEGPVRGERRWPSVAAVVVAMALTLLRPKELRIAPVWVLPAVEIVLLAVLMVRDPGRIDKRSSFLRGVSIAIVALLVLDALVATVRLIAALIEGGAMTNSPEILLAAGGVVWLSNLISFALLYWELDAGGAANRAHRMPRYLDLAFVQQISPEVAPPHWRPGFGDYLYLALTTSTAFSPTDVMPLAFWAKLAMGLQSLISLAVVGLVVARAVNVFS
ncbi:putative membrane protein [Kribbella amoyensis]|uniref:Putative membrane protein n=1 Tax=Kribbella amoyensis TaxID=996641 RepID=A0A561B780_9ACTN|nr:DUF1345 domain-containing protein [Kribbella amoyensis]TWD74835.1 putative membrane protein [Kribbella amoyensis]